MSGAVPDRQEFDALGRLLDELEDRVSQLEKELEDQRLSALTDVERKALRDAKARRWREHTDRVCAEKTGGHS
jgi:hypothetical protein